MNISALELAATRGSPSTSGSAALIFQPDLVNERQLRGNRVVQKNVRKPSYSGFLIPRVIITWLAGQPQPDPMP